MQFDGVGGLERSFLQPTVPKIGEASRVQAAQGTNTDKNTLVPAQGVTRIFN